ncbi:hypothetical protein [Aquimarina rhabdastrellae]
MKINALVFFVFRIIIGLSFVIYGLYNAIQYESFIGRIETYFGQVSFFNIGIIETLAPLVPFEKFLIGLLLILGYATQKVTKIAILLCSFFTIFLIDAHQFNLALIYVVFVMMMLVILKDEKNIYALNAKKEPYMFL